MNPVEGYKKNGLLYVPDYGTFLPSPQNRMRMKPQLVPEFKLSDAKAQKTEYINGLPKKLMTTLIQKGIFNPRSIRRQSENMFNLETVVEYKRDSSAVLSHKVEPNWKVYALRHIGGPGTLAAAFVAPEWNYEPIAVVDWLEGVDDTAEYTLHSAIEYLLKPTHEAIRFCHGLDYKEHGQKYIDLGYRLMNRTDNSNPPLQELDLIKIFGIDARVIDGN